MFFGDDLTTTAVIILAALAVGGLAFAIISPFLSGGASSSRLKAISSGTAIKKEGSSFRSRFQEDSKDTRRKQIQESLNAAGDREAKTKKKRATLRIKLEQAGLEISNRAFWVASAILGVVLAVVSLILGGNLYIAGAALFIGGLGLPRWILGFLQRRRQSIFLNDFADAIDVLVRGLKSGLPVSEAMKIIANESGPPVGPEFLEVVEGQRVGIPIDQGIERMVDRMPLPEVNFLGIVMTIQSKTGGNLSEALANLSRVLRDRKRMKQKVRSVSQEAKSSAAIIGSLPFVIMGMLTVLNPKYLRPLMDTNTGHILIICSGLWMLTGVLVMKKMINFQI
jgi:tight adherence protein B